MAPKVLGCEVPPVAIDGLTPFERHVLKRLDKQDAALLEVRGFVETSRTNLQNFERDFVAHTTAQAKKVRNRAWITTGTGSAFILGVLVIAGNIWMERIKSETALQAGSKAVTTVQEADRKLDERQKILIAETVRETMRQRPPEMAVIQAR